MWKLLSCVESRETIIYYLYVRYPLSVGVPQVIQLLHIKGPFIVSSVELVLETGDEKNGILLWVKA